MFNVNYDRGANCLNIEVRGFWKPKDVERFAKEMSLKARMARAIRGDFDGCVMSPDFPVQSMDVADLLAQVMKGAMTLTTGRAAVVVGSQLNKAQAERTLVHPKVRVFLSTVQAREWLSTPPSSAVPS